MISVVIITFLLSQSNGQWSEWTDWSECPPCQEVLSTGSRRLATGENAAPLEKNRVRTKQCIGPLECIDDDLPFEIGTNISKVVPCPPCEDKEDEPKPNLDPGKHCEIQEDGQEICLCPFGECNEENGNHINSSITTEASLLQHCLTFPCQNGGECLENTQSWLCLCKKGMKSPE